METPRLALPAELLAEIRRLYFQTSRSADQGLSGRYKSAFLGQGIEFEEVREYQPGDEIRSIDWKVTARSRKPFVKSYREERELTVVLAIDISSSLQTGSRSQLRRDLAAKVGAVLTFVALRNNDRVGLLLFSDRVHRFIPPKKSRGTAWRVLHEVLSPSETGGKTDFTVPCEYLARVLKRPAVVFLISDFFGKLDARSLSQLSRKHDVTAILATDPLDRELPNCGLAEIYDPESGTRVVIDTSEPRVRETYAKMSARAREQVRSTLRKSGLSILEFSGDRPFIKTLRSFFEQRKRRRQLELSVLRSGHGG